MTRSFIKSTQNYWALICFNLINLHTIYRQLLCWDPFQFRQISSKTLLMNNFSVILSVLVIAVAY